MEKMKVQWTHYILEEATWEIEDAMWEAYLLYTKMSHLSYAPS
jgi:hypothetical protein